MHIFNRISGILRRYKAARIATTTKEQRQDYDEMLRSIDCFKGAGKVDPKLQRKIRGKGGYLPTPQQAERAKRQRKSSY